PHRPPPHGARGLRSARRGRVLATHGAARRQWRPAPISLDPPEPRHARAAAPRVASRSAAVLRGCAARARRAALSASHHRRALSLARSARDLARLWKKFGVHVFCACNPLGGGVQPHFALAVSYLGSVEGRRRSPPATTEAALGGGVGAAAATASARESGKLGNFFRAVDSVARGNLRAPDERAGRRGGGGWSTPSGARRGACLAPSCPRRISRPGWSRCGRRGGPTASSRSRCRVASFASG